VGYLTIDAFRGNGKYDCSLFEGLEVVQETDYVAHVRLSEPLTIKIDGMKKEAVVLMPKELLEPKKKVCTSLEDENEILNDNDNLNDNENYNDNINENENLDGQ
jgi:hypothetical protein